MLASDGGSAEVVHAIERQVLLFSLEFALPTRLEHHHCPMRCLYLLLALRHGGKSSAEVLLSTLSDWRQMNGLDFPPERSIAISCRGADAPYS